MNIKERLSEFKEPNYFSRVDNSHILELYIGMDESGRKAIELRSGFAPRKILGTSCIDVNQYKKQNYNIIRFSLKESDISGLFYTFCEDLIEQTRDLKAETDGYVSIINRYHQWKKMFVSSKKDFLTEPEIMGLIGEILFMRDDLAQRIGLQNALKSWSGQELTHKDFSFNDQWFEVKTIHRASLSVKISSLEQLESKNEGELDVYSFEKMSPAYKGITLNKIIVETADMFEDEAVKNDFWAKVALQGYEYNDYYDDFVFQLCNHWKYKVNEKFPKLTPDNVPSAISKASYDLLLSELDEFRI